MLFSFSDLSPRNRNCLVFFFVLFIAHWSCLLGGWSSPPVVVYPSSSPFNASIPSIATDSKGNSVAVWIDLSGAGSLQGATLAAGAVNEVGQPDWVLTSPIASSNVQNDFNLYGQAVGMDAQGNATAIWTDGVHVFVSQLAPEESIWSSPVAISTEVEGQNVGSPYIAVASNGNIVATWSRLSNSYDGKVISNVYSAIKQQWLGENNLLGTAVEYNVDISPVAIDPVGNAVVVLKNNSIDIQAVSYNAAANAWTNIASVAGNIILSAAVAIDANGNAAIVWLEEDDSVNAAILASNATAFSNITILSTQALYAYASPRVVVDAEGKGVAIWVDVSEELASARYSPATSTWTALPLLKAGGDGVFFPFLSGDSRGYVLATWATGVFLNTGYIEASMLAPTDSSWQEKSKLSLGSSLSYFSRNALASKNGVAIWESDVAGIGEGGKIKSSIALDLFAPSVLQISPTSGPSGGGTSVVITGNQLTHTVAVYFGTKKAKSFTVSSDGEVIAISPRGQGVVDLIVETLYGFSSPSLDDQFTYNPIYPPKNIKTRQKFCLPGKKITNVIMWSPPSKGRRPVLYEIYSDRALTNLLATRKADRGEKHFQFKDRCVHKKNKYRYYIISVDRKGNRSTAAVVKIKTENLLDLKEINHCDCTQ